MHDFVDFDFLVSDEAVKRINPAAIEQEVVINVYEPLFFIRRGIQDVLGPLGLNTFSGEEWRGFWQ